MNNGIRCIAAIGLAMGCEALVAEKPPRGWNSYDSYTWSIDEDQVLQNAKAVAADLLPFGYEYVVIDYLWYMDAKNNSHMYIDDHGRLMPDPNRFPHSVNGSGFRWLSDQIHAMGLKFGIHIMRGISKQAMVANVPILGGQGATTADIYMNDEVCPWQKSFASINYTTSAGAAFEASLFSQYASWGVDFIKYDCVYGGNFELSQIQGASSTILSNKSQPMVLSLSPGDYKSPSEHANTISPISNMYRITNDDWDTWDDIKKHFVVSAEHAAANKIGSPGLNGLSWPDLDMLPFGWISQPGKSSGPYKWSSLTKGQQRTQMSLWCIARSPLMFGGAATMLRNPQDKNFTLSLLTNKQLLSANSDSHSNRQISSTFSPGSTTDVIASVWAASSNTKGTYFVSFFNVGFNASVELSASIFDVTLGDCSSSANSTNAFDGTAAMFTDGEIKASVDVNDVVFLTVYGCQ
eukprot:TRINITY_DN5208_c0_g1_i1.p1 TRINITY_DN5208_c0_g1~~TRINITY_DN5208_c0_g1_i1.p1  ORF type:complete len:464 (+),score=75.81 TRINITY_DN5208_c0_g1_i1:1172-2563(+)